MVIKRVYKLAFNDSVSFVKSISRYTIEEAFETMKDDEIIEISNTAQIGFFNDNGDFLNPTEALTEALECNQINDFMKMIIEKNNITKLQSSFLDNYKDVIS